MCSYYRLICEQVFVLSILFVHFGNKMDKMDKQETLLCKQMGVQIRMGVTKPFNKTQER